MNNKAKHYITLITVAIMIIISIIIRIPKNDEAYNNSDATYHVLLTMKCYESNPISVHKFLPIVSLGEVEDKNISWGSCVSDQKGNYYYTSFSAAGFVAPYLFIKIFNLPINIYSLYAFNSLIYIISFILMVYIFCKLFNKYIDKDWIIIFTAIIYLFQIEVMHSQGVIYWVQSIFQMLFAIQFILFLNYENKKCKIGFFIMCLIMPYVEWTGYISNIAFAIIIYAKNMSKNKRLTIQSFYEPAYVGILTILSFIIFSTHFLLNINFEDYILALINRFFARNITSNKVGISDLLKGYIISYKYTIMFIGILLSIILGIKKYRKRFLQLIKEYKYSIIIFSCIMLENIIMLQHAVAYTFDRLKLMYMLILLFFVIISTLYAECNKKKNITLLLTIILCGISIINIINYQNGEGNYIAINTYEENNNVFATYIKENYNHSNSILCSNQRIRGYMNILFERGIYENIGYESAKNLQIQQNKKYLIYIVREEELVIKEIIIKNLESNEQYKIWVENQEISKGENEI